MSDVNGLVAGRELGEVRERVGLAATRGQVERRAVADGHGHRGVGERVERVEADGGEHGGQLVGRRPEVAVLEPRAVCVPAALHSAEATGGGTVAS